MSGRNVWSQDLEELFHYNPPPVEKIDNPATYRRPFPFFDRHIDSRLALKRVVLVPSFTTDISEVVDREIKAHKDAGRPPPPANFEYGEIEDVCALPTTELRDWGEPRNIVTDASSVARFYMHVSYFYCSAVGSTLGLHPRSHTWLTVFHFDKAGSEPDEGHSAITNQFYLCIQEDEGARKISIPRGVWNCLDEDGRGDLIEVYTHFRRLVTYQFYAATNEYDKILEKMDNVAGNDSFMSFPRSVSGFPEQSSLLPPLVDSTVLPWISSEFDQASPCIHESTLLPEGPLHSARITLKNPSSKVDDVNAFIQHAWTRSVMDDTTFLIFHCGKYERIGVRHRATGTLFLSNLIDLHGCRDPAYGKIESGLYLLIIRDAIERAHQLRTSEVTLPRTSREEGQQVMPDDSHQTKKRPKTRSVTASLEKVKSLILHECDKKDLALLYVRHGRLNSPSPSAFLRRGCAVVPGVPCSDRQKHVIELRAQGYQSNEYFEILLTPDFESGATGQVHKSIIRTSLPDGRMLSYPVVIKIAFHDFQKERLRHEYNVYTYMASQRVKSVSSIFGIFEDVEDEFLMMIMSDTGISLYSRELKRNPGKLSIEEVSVSREEREAFKQALSEVHRAGVRHYDIRPQNLLIDDEGGATIIDFDMAKMGAGRHSRKREFDDLCRLLRGNYFPPNQVASSPTTQSSHPDSDFL